MASRYRLFLDEVGNDDIESSADARHRYLSLTGVVMIEEYERTTATERLNAIKEYFFDLPTERVWLHRKDIMNRRGPFQILNDPDVCKEFDDALIGYIQDLDFRVITVVIDKLVMKHTYHWRKRHPYHYLMEIIAEKYARFLDEAWSVGDIMPEKRQGKKDRELQAAYEEVLANGTDYVSPIIMSRTLPAKELKFRAKHHNITGLQLCDLIAHPSQQFVRRRQGHDVVLAPFAKRVLDFVEPYKYHRRSDGRILGYGIKYLP